MRICDKDHWMRDPLETRSRDMNNMNSCPPKRARITIQEIFFTTIAWDRKHPNRTGAQSTA
jgi:hypothetical protein